MQPANDARLKAFYQDKTILVTGGIGSIGGEIVAQILTYQPKQLRILDTRETEIFNLQNTLKHHPNIRFLVGDVRDKDRMIHACKGVDIMFHAAALKHVGSCEYNPAEAVKTNVLGTQNAIDAALANNVDRFIMISTDKAVSPTTTMGATKLVAERLTLNAHLSSPHTKFSCVRFGNVLNSRGSVIPLFVEQILKKQPITITHP
ncbi:MAG: polysaccharide biosynthesis protein, partial [Nanoarchaeota archaeon]